MTPLTDPRFERSKAREADTVDPILDLDTVAPLVTQMVKVWQKIYYLSLQ